MHTMMLIRSSRRSSESSKESYMKNPPTEWRDLRVTSETRSTNTSWPFTSSRETWSRRQERPLSTPAPTTALSNQRSQTTATRRTKPIGRTSSALLQLASRRGSRRVLPRSLGETSQTPSSGGQTTAISIRWISFISTNSSPPSQRGQRDQIQQTYGDSSSKSQGKFSTGGRQSRPTSNEWQQWLQNLWVTVCAYTATYAQS